MQWMQEKCSIVNRDDDVNHERIQNPNEGLLGYIDAEQKNRINARDVRLLSGSKGASPKCLATSR